ncbi:MAG: Gfo/Idh/MocA family oxidoreductase [Coxiellaceae bacterium]|nr:Gfo/Idh/MocA family oxidoreductase [Coxiellaceae bacterium]
MRKKLNILDSTLLDECVRVKNLGFIRVKKIEKQYFVREAFLSKIIAYVNEIGIKNTFFKVVSRHKEKIRNKKYLSVGFGRVLDSKSAAFSENETIIFIAYNHPAYPERLVLHQNFVKKIQPIQSNEEKVFFGKEDGFLDITWTPFLAWSPFSGVTAPHVDAHIWQRIEEYWIQFFKENKLNGIAIQSTPTLEIKECAAKKSIKKTGVLFGYGNYAKTIILPNLHKDIAITCIHEIDPAQIMPMKKNIRYDTSPFLRENERYDAFFIAGYHHTHADLAISALKMNSDAIVEKPIVITRNQLQNLLVAMSKSTAGLYACYQRRYHIFNTYLFQDFKIKKGDPISYFAIVYEEQLPEYHWYRWPASRSNIISNGCHWIDHFLFLNNYSEPVNFYAKKISNHETFVFITLENGAAFTLTLSHTGSSRIGMQDYIELRSQDATAKIINSKTYFAENSSRVLRKTAVQKFDAFKRMYCKISEDIGNTARSKLNENPKQMESTLSLILDLDEQIL